MGSRARSEPGRRGRGRRRRGRDQRGDLGPFLPRPGHGVDHRCADGGTVGRVVPELDQGGHPHWIHRGQIDRGRRVGHDARRRRHGLGQPGPNLLEVTRSDPHLHLGSTRPLFGVIEEGLLEHLRIGQMGQTPARLFISTTFPECPRDSISSPTWIGRRVCSRMPAAKFSAIPRRARPRTTAMTIAAAISGWMGAPSRERAIPTPRKMTTWPALRQRRIRADPHQDSRCPTWQRGGGHRRGDDPIRRHHLREDAERAGGDFGRTRGASRPGQEHRSGLSAC